MFSLVRDRKLAFRKNPIHIQERWVTITHAFFLNWGSFARWPYGNASCFVGRTLPLLLPLWFYCSGFKSVFLNSRTAHVFLGTERWSSYIRASTHCKYSCVFQSSPLFQWEFTFFQYRMCQVWVGNVSMCIPIKFHCFFLYKIMIHIFVLHHLFQPSGFPSILLMMSTCWKQILFSRFQKIYLLALCWKAYLLSTEF